jgi:3-oxoadipate enol-lactonase
MTPQESQRRTSGQVAQDGARIQFESCGDPALPVVVCIHGVTLDRDAFADQVPALGAAGYRVITWDLRGHGRSRPMTGRFSIDASTRDLAALLDHLAVNRAVLVGQSFGGLVAQKFSRRWPERVSGLVLVGCPRLGDRPAWPRRLLERARPLLLRLWPERHLRRILPAFLSREPAVQEYVATATARLTKEEFVATTRAALEGLLRHEDEEPVSMPVLVVHGNREQAMVRKLINAWAVRDPGVETVVMDGADHLANQDRPADFNQVLLLFLHRVRPDRHAAGTGESPVVPGRGRPTECP